MYLKERLSSYRSSDKETPCVFQQTIYPFLVIKNQAVSISCLDAHLKSQGHILSLESLQNLLLLYPDHVVVTKDGRNGQNSFVEAVTKIEFCKNFNGKKNCVSLSCDMLHICRHYIKGKCNFGKKCNKPHSFNDFRTLRLLEDFFFARVPEESLRAFLCRHVQYSLDEKETDLPKHIEICHYYNVAPGCSRGNDCPYLHICKFYAQEGTCKFAKQCMRSHTLASQHSNIILERYGFDEQSALAHFQLENITEKREIDTKLTSLRNSRSTMKYLKPLSPNERITEKSLAFSHPLHYFMSLELSKYPANSIGFAAHEVNGQKFERPKMTPAINFGPWTYNYRSYRTYDKSFDLFGDPKTTFSLCNAVTPFDPVKGRSYSDLLDNNSANGKQTTDICFSRGDPKFCILDDNKICYQHLDDPGSKHKCSHANDEEPFFWQIRCVAEKNHGGWNDLSSEENLRLEELFCDPQNDTGMVTCGESQLTVIFEDEKFGPTGELEKSTTSTFDGEKKSFGTISTCQFRRLSTESFISGTENSLQSKWNWYKRSETGKWTSYDDEAATKGHNVKITSADIEKNFCKEGQAFLVVQQDLTYVIIDFLQMTETNSKTKCKRKVRRRPIHQLMRKQSYDRAEERKVLTSYSWPDLNQGNGSPKTSTEELFYRIELPETSQPFIKISEEFGKTMKNWKITKIESIQNMSLLMAYKRKKDEMHESMQRKPREKYLYHALGSNENAVTLCSQGFSSPNSQGTYFARDALLAHERAKKANCLLFQMIVFRVVIPPVVENPTVTLFGSCRKNEISNPMNELYCTYRNDSPLYAVYSSSHAYPEFLITYCGAQ